MISILFAGLVIFSQPPDSVLTKYPFTNASTSLISKDEYAEVIFKVANTYYETGDTVEVLIHINNVGEAPLLVWNPPFFEDKVLFNNGQAREIVIDMDADFDAHPLWMRKLKRIEEGQSIEYKADVVIDSSILIDEVIAVDISCSTICWKYESSMDYLTQGEGDIDAIKGSAGAIDVIRNSLQYYPGKIEIYIFESLDKVLIER